MVAMIVTSPSQLRYDERNHIGLTQIVATNGWHDALLSAENQSAAGPLYPAIHMMLSPITHLQPPAIRWVNFCCFLGVILVLAGCKPAEPVAPTLLSGFTLLAVPFLWPAVGMALTELPALLFFTCFVLLFLRVINSDVVLSRGTFVLAFLAGLCLGAAILGRQTYLIVVPALAVMMFCLREKWLPVLICIFTSLAVCCWLFVIWHGLAPPHYYRAAESSGRFANLLLSLSYAAVATLFLNPAWLWYQRGKAWIVCALCGFALSYFARNYEDPPAKSLIVHTFGNQFGVWIGFVAGCALAAIGAVWAWTMFKTFWRERRNRGQVFLLLSLGALVLAPMKMTAQFSSRYIVGYLGLLFLVVDAPLKPSQYWAARMFVGTVLGMAILWSYFQQS
jgi:hypothetical protein